MNGGNGAIGLKLMKVFAVFLELNELKKFGFLSFEKSKFMGFDRV